MRILIATLLLVTAGACASASEGGSYSTGSRTLITYEEIEGSDQLNAYELIRALRPNWLRIRGPNSMRRTNPIGVYLDGSRYGAGPRALMAISRANIRQIRYYNARAATTRFGTDNSNGAVDIRTRSR
jgi:hypothetical protein